MYVLCMYVYKYTTGMCCMHRTRKVIRFSEIGIADSCELLYGCWELSHIWDICKTKLLIHEPFTVDPNYSSLNCCFVLGVGGMLRHECGYLRET